MSSIHLIQRTKLFSWILLLSCAALAACSSLLPSARNTMRSVWPDFTSVQRAYEGLQVQQTTLEDLRTAQFHPSVNPNVSVLSQADVLRRFVIPNTPLELLDPGVRECLIAAQKCVGYEVDVRQIDRKRVGNFFLDFTNFRRQTEIRGWRFNAVLLVKENVLIYKTWSGQAQIAEEEGTRNPLGPLQSIDPQTLIHY